MFPTADAWDEESDSVMERSINCGGQKRKQIKTDHTCCTHSHIKKNKTITQLPHIKFMTQYPEWKSLAKILLSRVVRFVNKRFSGQKYQNGYNYISSMKFFLNNCRNRYKLLVNKFQNKYNYIEDIKFLINSDKIGTTNTIVVYK